VLGNLVALRLAVTLRLRNFRLGLLSKLRCRQKDKNAVCQARLDYKKSVCNPFFPSVNRAMDDSALFRRLEAGSRGTSQIEG
jgi:hypothetical protein